MTAVDDVDTSLILIDMFKPLSVSVELVVFDSQFFGWMIKSKNGSPVSFLSCLKLFSNDTGEGGTNLKV